MEEQVAPDLTVPQMHRGARVLPALFLGRGGGGRRICAIAPVCAQRVSHFHLLGHFRTRCITCDLAPGVPTARA